MTHRTVRRLVLVLLLTLLAATAALVGLARSSPIDSSPREEGGPPAEPENDDAPALPPLTERDVAVWPFAADSPWNTPIGRGARFLSSSDPVNRLLTISDIPAAINASSWSHPVVRGTILDPVRPVNYDVSNEPPFVGAVEIHIPDGVSGASGTDGHLHVISPDGSVAYEFFQFRNEGGTLRAAYFVTTDLFGPGVGDGGTRAYGGSALGGLIRRWELERGEIRHALALALTNEQLAQGPVWPAVEEDGNASETYSGAIPMGTLVAIPEDIDLASLRLSPGGMAIARSLQQYGAYVVDRSDAFNLYAEPSAEDLLAGVRSDLATIRQQLRIVTNAGPDQVGGPGVRLAPPAPPIIGLGP